MYGSLTLLRSAHKLLVVNSARFRIYVATRSYSSHPFLCALTRYKGEARAVGHVALQYDGT